ncbi:MAG TPA: DUF3237 domain-containing protein [Burkholderiales bacterium]|nr:DUF3237 domain-containing protein [Burkholderiales bacterium]
MQSEFLMRIRAEFEEPRVLAGTPLGARRIITVKSGEFAGPGLEGKLLPGSGDWVLVRPDGVAELDIRFTLATTEGSLIYMRSTGLLDAPRGYFRTSAVFETGAEAHAHLNRLIAVGVGQRLPTGMATELHAVK